MAQRTLRILLPSLALAICANAATFTVFDVLPTGASLPSISLSPLGVGSDGATTYDYVEVDTAEVVSDATITITRSIPPATFHATFIADSTRNYNSLAPGPTSPVGIVSNCTWGADGEGTCIAVLVDEQLHSTETQTVTGQAVPIYTVTVDGSVGSGSPTHTTITPTGAGTLTNPPPANQSNAAIGRSAGLYIGSAFAVVLGLLF